MFFAKVILHKIFVKTVYQNELVCMKEHHVRPQMKEIQNMVLNTVYLFFKNHLLHVCVCVRMCGHYLKGCVNRF